MFVRILIDALPLHLILDVLTFLVQPLYLLRVICVNVKIYRQPIVLTLVYFCDSASVGTRYGSLVLQNE